MDERVKKLFLMQLRHNGIPSKEYAKLKASEKNILEKKNGRYYLKNKFRKRIKVVLTGGVFDILHAGHVFTLNEAKKMGDVLVVAVARDEQLRRMKTREPVHSEEYRKMMVEYLKPVDIALAGFRDPRRMLELVKPDVIVYGYDQVIFLKPKGVETVKLKKHLEEGKFKTHRIIKNLGI